MTVKLLLDSGAFTTWSQGAVIDLAHYRSFCARHPDCSYYVNLDVIPGKPRQPKTITKESVEKSCQEGWDNYLYLIDVLPKSKVIPVFHMNDGFHWLDKYLNYGVKYIGVSPANDRSTKDKLQWLKQCRKYLFDSAGRRTVNQHGFAVTSYSLMNFWDWFSVDSASWKMCASWGGIYLPHKSKGSFDFLRPPIQVQCTPQTPGSKRRRNGHTESLTDGVKGRVDEWLRWCTHELQRRQVNLCHPLNEIVMGKHTVEKMEGKYTLDYGRADCWLDKKERLLMRVEQEGVTNSFKSRAWVNQVFMEQANAVLPVENLYLAGLPMPYESETSIPYRLLSYEQVGKKTTCKWFLRHCKALRNLRG